MDTSWMPGPGTCEPAGNDVLEEPDARIGRFGAHTVQMQQDRVALGRDPVGDRHRLTSVMGIPVVRS